MTACGTVLAFGLTAAFGMGCAELWAQSFTDIRIEPDPVMTPGTANPAVTQDTIGATICARGWTKTVRPPVSYTEPLKIKIMDAYGYAGLALKQFELDHLIPLEVGGNPTDPGNLWPEPWNGTWGAHTKDRLENALRREVCAGRVTLADAQAMIRTDWIAAYKQVFGEVPRRATSE